MNITAMTAKQNLGVEADRERSEGHDTNIRAATMAEQRRAEAVQRGGAARCYAEGKHCNLSLLLTFL